MLLIWLACTGDSEGRRQPPAEEVPVVPERCLGFEELAGERVTTDEELQAALAAGASPILLEAGTYTGGFEVTGELVGACPEWVTLEGGLLVSGSASGFTMVGALEGGVLLSGTLSEVVIEDAEAFGVRVEGGSAWLEDVTVQGTRRATATGGYGLEVKEGAEVEVVGGLFTDNWNRNISVQDSVLTATGTTMSQGVTSSSGTGGHGLYLNAATATLVDSLVDENPNAGIYVTGGADLFLEDSVVSNSYPPLDYPAVGIDARGGRVVMTGGALLANNGGGIVTSSGVDTELQGVEIAYHEVTRSQLVGGYGVDALNGSTLVIRDCWIHDNMTAGFLADGAPYVLVEDTLIESLQPGFTVPVAVGAFFRDSEGTIRNTTVRAVEGAGMSVYGGHVVAESITVEDIDHVGLSDSGHGVEVALAGLLEMSDSTVQRVGEAGFLCDGEGTTVVLERVDVMDVVGSATKEVGLGLHAQTGCALTAREVVVERPMFVGVGGFLSGTSMVLEEVEVLDVQVTEDGEFGWGGAFTFNSALVTDGLVIDGSVGAGLQVAEGSTAELVDTTVRNVRRPAEQSTAFGVGIHNDVSVSATGLVVEDIEGPGITCAIADLDCSDCSVDGVTFAGFALEFCEATLSSVEVSDVSEDASEGGGIGLFIEEPSYGPATVLLEDSSVSDTELAAVWIQGPSSVELVGNALEAGSARDIGGGVEVHGDVVLARDGVEDLLLQDNTLSGATGVGLLLHGSTARLVDNTWSDNATDLVQQNCEDVPTDPEGLGDVGTYAICPEYDEVVLDLHYDAYLTESIPY